MKKALAMRSVHECAEFTDTLMPRWCPNNSESSGAITPAQRSDKSGFARCPTPEILTYA